MFCKNCGAQIADTATFCPNCGQAVQSVAAPVQPGTPVAPIVTKPLLGIPFLENEDPSKKTFQIVAKLLIVIGMFLGFISTFLPYFKVSASLFGQHYSESANLFALGGGYAFMAVIILLSSVAGILFALLGKGKLQKLAGIFGIVNVFFNFVAGIAATAQSFGLGSLTVGYYFIWLGGIACIVGWVFTLVKKLHRVA